MFHKNNRIIASVSAFHMWKPYRDRNKKYHRIDGSMINIKVSKEKRFQSETQTNSNMDIVASDFMLMPFAVYTRLSLHVYIFTSISLYHVAFSGWDHLYNETFPLDLLIRCLVELVSRRLRLLDISFTRTHIATGG